MITKIAPYFRRFLTLLLNISSLSVLFAVAAPALACTPTAPPVMPPTPTSSPTPRIFTLEDFVNNAQFILVGTVTADMSSHYEDSLITQVEIRVERYLKGTGPSIVIIGGFGSGALCHSAVFVGERYIFYANGDTDGIMRAAYIGTHDATLVASEENITALFAITNQSFLPNDITPSPTATSTATITLTATASSTVTATDTATATNTPTATPKPGGAPDMTKEVDKITQTEAATPEPALQADGDRQLLLNFSIAMVILSSAGLIALFIYVRSR